MGEGAQVLRGTADPIRIGHGRSGFAGAGVRIAAAFLAAALLGGCVTDAPATSSPSPTPAIGATAAAVAKPAGAPVPAPDRLLGAPAERVLAALGKPELQRRERPAEIWQYRGRGCVLDVFLYAAGQQAGTDPKIAGQAAGDGPTVFHLEARDARARSIEPASCLPAVTSARLES